jgi:regulator of replication initiation timing
VAVKQLAVHQDDSNVSLDHLVLQLVNIYEEGFIFCNSFTSSFKH